MLPHTHTSEVQQDLGPGPGSALPPRLAAESPAASAPVQQSVQKTLCQVPLSGGHPEARL
ncbi:hypothetical protein EWB00_000122 [Schistosoma japonicum]|uniref:Uncharacterized protein n=1 Tax=Schistosoma japonicum TaxID=6182 RepID=A0A4Z2CKM2_SCHJA|nr:hypothetical protein EWB00_000122 [Schistosoma japonicum]